MEYKGHYSVLKKEILSFITEKFLDEKEPQYFSDFTFGGGGHSLEILKQSPQFNLVSFDQDPEALKNGKERIVENGVENRINLVDSNFENFPEIINKDFSHIVENGGFSGIIMDLGVSSHHFDSHERGFSFRFDSDLDMRMNPRDEDHLTAKQIINTYTSEELEEIFYKYGEEKLTKSIVANIIKERENKDIESTKELENIIFHTYPKKMRFGSIHPATKCFQALRIEVNRELDIISDLIPRLLPFLKIGGRIAIISFHSLEDRIVKTCFKSLEKSDLPCQIITKKPITPSEEEISENSRSRSAKLRVIERVLVKKTKNKYQNLGSE